MSEPSKPEVVVCHFEPKELTHEDKIQRMETMIPQYDADGDGKVSEDGISLIIINSNF